MANKQQEMDERLKSAKNSGAAEYYTNGSVLGIGSSDIVVIFERNNEPVAIFNLSYTSAKSLSLNLGTLIAQIEERAGRDIMTSADIDKLFASENSTGKNNELAIGRSTSASTGARNKNRTKAN